MCTFINYEKRKKTLKKRTKQKTKQLKKKNDRKLRMNITVVFLIK
jgi:hypothetical protein